MHRCVYDHWFIHIDNTISQMIVGAAGANARRRRRKEKVIVVEELNLA